MPIKRKARWSRSNMMMRVGAKKRTVITSIWETLPLDTRCKWKPHRRWRPGRSVWMLGVRSWASPKKLRAGQCSNTWCTWTWFTKSRYRPRTCLYILLRKGYRMLKSCSLCWSRVRKHLICSPSRVLANRCNLGRGCCLWGKNCSQSRQMVGINGTGMAQTRGLAKRR